MDPDLLREEQEPTEEHRAAIDDVVRFRVLADRLAGLLDDGRPAAG